MSKRKKSKLGIIIAIALFAYFVYIILNQQKILSEKKAELDAANNKYTKEMQINEDLKKQKEMINSDEYVEKAAREKLDMVKQGERVYVDVNK